MRRTAVRESELAIRNRQKRHTINLRLFRSIVQHLLDNHSETHDWQLCIHLIGKVEMARINEKFLQHDGSTDVITFDHAETEKRLHGELFISIDDAVSQAREFRTTWPSELVRYVIHGLLHLKGFDDLKPAARRIMKREESRILREVEKKFAVKDLGEIIPKLHG